MRIRKYVETYILCSREYTSPPLFTSHATPVLIVSRTFLHYARERERGWNPLRCKYLQFIHNTLYRSGVGNGIWFEFRERHARGRRKMKSIPSLVLPWRMLIKIRPSCATALKRGCTIWLWRDGLQLSL